MSRGYWKRAKIDTWALIGEPATLVIGGIGAIVGGWLYIKAQVIVAAEVDVRDVVLSLLSAGASVVIMGALLFIYNLVRAPHRVERDRADAAEAEVAKLQESLHVDVPRAHLQAMERYDGSLSELGERLNVITHLVRQYGYLSNNSRQSSARFGKSPDNAELVEIAELIVSQISRFAPKLPPSPFDGLKISMGWNHDLYIFIAPMRVPPRITISNLPEGAHAEVSNVTRISFEVKFWPQQTQVTSYTVEADASLPPIGGFPEPQSPQGTR